ncbi:hypothetical protein [Mycobacterium sp.]|uniref:hypothetical protein n=1 Tax=Mycobacterium sp. TaxID=1785 RepID=UPI002D77D530|nr:hypothetical protein [Mycobacterium sp.]
MSVLYARAREGVARAAVVATATGFRRSAMTTRDDPLGGPAKGVQLSMGAALHGNPAKGIIMLRRGFVASASMGMLGMALLGGAPTASADVVSLGDLTVDTGVERPDGSRLITVSGVDSPWDHINVRTPDGKQFERSPQNGIATFIVNRNQPEVAVQPCGRNVLGNSRCGDWSTFYPYKGSPPPVAAQQPPQQHPPQQHPPQQQQPPAAPPKPLQGPTVSANPGLTGVTFHVTDRSGVTSQCTYSSEGYTASFGLPANGSFDLSVPAVREFRNRTGTITCDNGTSTNTSVFF